MYDLLIIGSGSAGVAAAIEAAENGATVAVIEAETVGGTCVNVGCVPSKTLLRAAEAYHRAGQRPFKGIATQANDVDLKAVISQKDELVEGLRQAKYADVLASYAVPLLKGKARFISPERLELNGEPLQAKRYLIASGAEATLPPISGLRESQPWTYIEALAPDIHPESLLVIGGGPIGLEIAQAYARLGTKVTVLEALPRILPTEDEALSTDLKGYLEAEGLEIYTGAKVSAVKLSGKYEVSAEFNDRKRSFSVDRLLVATGRRPRTQGLGLAAAAVDTDTGGAIKVNDYLASSNPKIYAAGDVAGLPQFVYVAAQSGRIAAKNALQNKASPLDLSALPRVTFSDPAVAAVGLTEAEARAKHQDIRVSVLPMDQVPRALAAFDTRGFIKLVVNGEGTILGVHVLAPEAGEIIQEGIMAIKFELNYRDLIDTFHPYLTAVEGLRLVAQAMDKDVGQLSCCA